MHKLLQSILVTLFSFNFTLSLMAQNPIPNAGFENWTGDNLEGWWENNLFEPHPVTPSNDAHSGSLSAKLEAVEWSSVPIPPSMISGDSLGFAVTERHATLTGFYKFTPVANEMLNISVGMFFGADSAVGISLLSITTAASNWTKFSTPITYFSSATPDTCIIQFSVSLGSPFMAGAVALIDDLSFDGATDVEAINSDEIPNDFYLEQNYPNPFNPSTVIRYSIPNSGYVSINIYSVKGEVVATLVGEDLSAGYYEVTFDASRLPSGIYFYRLQTGSFIKSKKMALIK